MRKATHTPALPPIPKEVRHASGSYRVIRADPPRDPDDKDELLLGHCNVESRTILVKPRISRAVAWLTLEHEVIHAILFDAGVRLSKQKEEDVANAIAAHRVFEMNHHE